MIDFDDSTVDNDSQFNSSNQDDLKSSIYKEFMFTLHSFYFSFNVNKNQLANNMISSTYSILSDIDSQFSLSRSADPSSLKLKFKLFISFYCYAFMIHFILKNPQYDISLVNMTSKLTTSDHKTNLVTLLKYSIANILSTKNMILNQLNISSDFIKNYIIDAYNFLNKKDSTLFIYSESSFDFYFELLIDPIYHYLFFINSLFNKKHFSHTKHTLYDSIQTLLSIDLSKIKKKKDTPLNPFSLMLLPDFSKLNSDKSSFLSLSPSKYLSITPAVFESANRDYIALSFTNYIDVIKNQMFKSVVFSNGQLSPYFSSRNSDYIAFRSLENTLFAHFSLPFLKPLRFLPDSLFPSLSRFSSLPSIPLSRVYDTNGVKHSWSIFIFNDGVELPLSSFDSSISLNTLPASSFIDKRCSICNIKFSELSSLSDSVISSSILSSIDFHNFFKFFLLKCPEGDHHTFPSDNNNSMLSNNGMSCSKCGFSSGAIFDKSSYFKKYFSVYEQSISDLFQSSFSLKTNLLQFKTTLLPLINSSSLSLTQDSIVELSKMLKINSNLSFQLGNFENIDFEEILSGKFISPEEDFFDSFRLYKLDSYVLFLFIEYNKLRFYHKLSFIPPYLKSLLASSQFNSALLSQLPSLLPDIYDNYNENVLWFKRNKKPKDLVYYILTVFFQKLLSIYSSPEPLTKTLRHLFVSFIFSSILDKDTKLTKYNKFDWSLLFPDNTMKKINFEASVISDTSPDADPDSTPAETNITSNSTADDGDEDDSSNPLQNNYDVDIIDSEAIDIDDTGGLGDNDLKSSND